MDLYLIVLAIILFAMTIKNIITIRKSANAKEYTHIYQSFLRDEEDVESKLEAYLNKEKSLEFINKARILKVYLDIEKGYDAVASCNSIDFKEIMFAKDKFSDEMYVNNADSNAWLILNIVKANKENKQDVADTLINRINEYEQYLNKYVEYNTLTSIYKCLYNIDDEGVEFLRKLLNGEYAGYSYNKKMVGLFKKLAATILIYKGETLSEDDVLLVKDFANNYIGRKIMTDLSIYDQYKPLEIPQEDAIENKEEK